MKKIYLLAGSLGLLGTMTQMPQAIATTPDPDADFQLQRAIAFNPSTELQLAAVAAPIAAPNPTPQPALAPALPSAATPATPLLIASTPSVSDLISDLKENQTEGQVTSVSQLSDVQPTDWAFQALQSLVERYGCIAGYPDGTFRGNRAATRYELAAALNACLDSLSDRFVTKEDLAALKALQDEFAAELATLRGRVDSLEARTATLEAQQFSTTTKLQGEAIIGFQFGQTDSDGNIPFGIGDVGAETGRPTAIARVRLSFNSSFTGNDLLQTQLEVGNEGQDLISALGVGSAFIDGGAADFAGVPNEVSLRRLSYTFKPIQDLAITIGPRIFPSDFVDFNSFANNSAQDFSSGFFINNPLIITNAVDAFGGAGLAFDWNVGGGPFTVRATYVAADAASAIPGGNDFLANRFNISPPGAFGGGLAGDPYQATAELEFADTFGKQGSFALRLQYTRSTTFNLTQDVAGANAEVSFGRFGLFGRYGWAPSSTNGIQTATPGQGAPLGAGVFGGVPALFQGSPDFTAQAWMAGVGVRDLFVPGSLLAAAVGQPSINNLDEVSVNGVTFNNETQWNYEAFYRFPVNDNITVTPTIMVIQNANNSDASPTIFQGLVRTTFSF